MLGMDEMTTNRTRPQAGAHTATRRGGAVTSDATATIRSRDRRTGARLLITFVAIGLVVAIGSAAPGTASVFVAAVALLIGACSLPAGLWRGRGRRARVTHAGRLASAGLLTGAWAATLGGTAVGWAGTTSMTLALLAWAAALLRDVVPLTGMRLFAGVAALVTATLGVGVVTGPTAGGSMTEQLALGAADPAFLPGLLAGSVGVGVSSVASLARGTSRLGGATVLRSLAASFGGLTLLALAGVVVVSTPDLTGGSNGQSWQFSAAARAIALTGIAAVLLGAGAYTARRGVLSPLGVLPLIGSVVAAIAAGWFGFTAVGAPVIPALVLLVTGAAFALVAGASLAAAMVRDAAALRARLARDAQRVPRGEPIPGRGGDTQVGAVPQGAH